MDLVVICLYLETLASILIIVNPAIAASATSKYIEDGGNKRNSWKQQQNIRYYDDPLVTARTSTSFAGKNRKTTKKRGLNLFGGLASAYSRNGFEAGFEPIPHDLNTKGSFDDENFDISDGIGIHNAQDHSNQIMNNFFHTNNGAVKTNNVLTSGQLSVASSGKESPATMSISYGSNSITGGGAIPYMNGAYENTNSASLKTIYITKEVPVPYPVHVEKKVPFYVKVPVDKPFPVTINRPYPVHIEKPIPFPVKVHVPKPYPITVEKHVPYPVQIPVDKLIPVQVPRPYPIYLERKVPITVEKPIPYPVKLPVDRPYPVHFTIEKPVPVHIEKRIPFPIKIAVEKPVPVPIMTNPNSNTKPVQFFTTVERSPYTVKVPLRLPVKISSYKQETIPQLQTTNDSGNGAPESNSISSMNSGMHNMEAFKFDNSFINDHGSNSNENPGGTNHGHDFNEHNTFNFSNSLSTSGHDSTNSAFGDDYNSDDSAFEMPPFNFDQESMNDSNTSANFNDKDFGAGE